MTRTAHAHPMVSKSDVRWMNEKYAPWRIEKAHELGFGFITEARNTKTGEVIYRCEGWNKASRGQALNAILERQS